MNTVIYDRQRYNNPKRILNQLQRLLKTFSTALMWKTKKVYCISSGLCATLDIQEDLLKAEIYGKEMRDKFIKEHLETRINFFDSIKK